MTDAFPMIVRCVMLQGKEGYPGEYHPYPACVDCGREVTRDDDFLSVFNCGWCEKKGIATKWLTPKRQDGRIVLEEGGKVEAMFYADA